MFSANGNCAIAGSIELKVQELLKLKNRFIAIQNTLTGSPIYSAEFDYFSNPSNSHHDQFYTAPFQANIIEEFESACQQYEELVASLNTIIPAQEIRLIQQAVLDAARAGELHTLQFYSTLQGMHATKAAKYREKASECIDKNNKKIESLTTSYKNRASNYMTCHIAFGIVSPLVIGIPFLLTSLIIHAIDKLIFLTRTKRLASENQKLQKEIDMQFYPELPHFKEYATKDPNTRLRHFFFEATQAKHRNPVCKLPMRKRDLST